MKKLLSVLLSAIMAFSALSAMPFSVFAASEIAESGSLGTSTEYTFDFDSGTITITGSGYYSAMSFSFSDTDKIKHLVLGEGITTALGFKDCINLESVTFSSTVTQISYDAFNGCKKLSSITLPEGITQVYSRAFKDCPLTSIHIPKNVYNFSGDAVDAQNLTSITVDPENKYYKTIDGNLYYTSNGVSLEMYAAGKSDSTFTLPEKAGIKSGAFASCDENCKLKTVIIPAGQLISIPSGAFKNAASIENIVLEEPISYVSSNAFENCTSLKSFPFSDVKRIESGAFKNCTSLSGEITLSSELVKINYDAFLGCTGITKLIIPNPNTDIDSSKKTIPQNITIAGYVKCDGTDSTALTYAKNNENPIENLGTLEHSYGKAVEEKRVEPTYDSDGSYDEVTYCTICGQEASRVTHTLPRIQSWDQIIDTATLEFESASDVQTYRFTPVENANYKFQCLNRNRVFVTAELYLDGEKIATALDNGYMFCLSAPLQANKEYEYRVHIMNDEEYGSCTVQLSKLNIKEIKFDFANNYKYLEKISGEYATDSNGEKYFHYYSNNYSKGDTLTIIDNDGNEYPFEKDYNDLYIYTAPDGTKTNISDDYVVIDDGQAEIHWEYGKDNKITVNAFGYTCSLPVTIKKLNVKSIKYTPVSIQEVPAYLLNTYYYNLGCIDINTETGDEYYRYDEDAIIDYIMRDGDKFSITYDDGSTVTYTLNEYEFIDNKGNILNIFPNIELDQTETPIKTGINKIKLYLGDASCELPFNIVENKDSDGSTYAFEADEPITVSAYSNGEYINGKFCYNIFSLLAKAEGAKIVKTTNGTSVSYKYDKNFNGFDFGISVFGDDEAYLNAIFTNYNKIDWAPGGTYNAVLKFGGNSVNIPVTVLETGIKDVTLSGYTNPSVDGNANGTKIIKSSSKTYQYFDWKSSSYPLNESTALTITETNGTQTEYTFNTKTKQFEDEKGTACNYSFTLSDTQSTAPWKNGTNYVYFYCCGKKINIPVSVTNSKNPIKEDAPSPAPAAKISIAKAAVGGIKNKTYTGKNLAQSIAVKLNGKALKAGTDYIVSYKNNKNVGTAAVIITGKGNYTGTIRKSFAVLPKPTTLKKLTKGKKQFKVTWKKQAVQTTGYQIQYSTNKNFKKGNKLINIGKSKTTSRAVKKLKKNKKYYVRIRTYKKVGKTTYYSTWSKAKSVKIK